MAHDSRQAIARAVVQKLQAAGADEKSVMRELAAYLVEHNMTEDAEVIINDIAQELYETTGRLVVEVTSARELTEDARQRLTDHFKLTTQAKSVELHETVDETLIGGLIAKTPTAELDLSIRTKLRQLTGLAG